MQRTTRPCVKSQEPTAFKQKQERFSKNVCHCKTCLHAFTCPCWHSLTYCWNNKNSLFNRIPRVCVLGESQLQILCRKMSYIGANNIAFTSAVDEQKCTLLRGGHRNLEHYMSHLPFFSHAKQHAAGLATTALPARSIHVRSIIHSITTVEK